MHHRLKFSEQALHSTRTWRSSQKVIYNPPTFQPSSYPAFSNILRLRHKHHGFIPHTRARLTLNTLVRPTLFATTCLSQPQGSLHRVRADTPSIQHWAGCFVSNRRLAAPANSANISSFSGSTGSSNRHWKKNTSVLSPVLVGLWQVAEPESQKTAWRNIYIYILYIYIYIPSREVCRLMP